MLLVTIKLYLFFLPDGLRMPLFLRALLSVRAQLHGGGRLVQLHSLGCQPPGEWKRGHESKLSFF